MPLKLSWLTGHKPLEDRADSAVTWMYDHALGELLDDERAGRAAETETGQVFALIAAEADRRGLTTPDWRRRRLQKQRQYLHGTIRSLVRQCVEETQPEHDTWRRLMSMDPEAADDQYALYRTQTEAWDKRIAPWAERLRSVEESLAREYGRKTPLTDVDRLRWDAISIYHWRKHAESITDEQRAQQEFEWAIATPLRRCVLMMYRLSPSVLGLEDAELRPSAEWLRAWRIYTHAQMHRRRWVWDGDDFLWPHRECVWANRIVKDWSLFFVAPRSAARGQTIHSLGLSGRVRNPLWDAGVRTVSELELLTDADLESIKGLGKKSLRAIREKVPSP